MVDKKLSYRRGTARCVVSIEILPIARGHSRSTAMLPFDRAHTTPYSTLIETMCVYRLYLVLTNKISSKQPNSYLLLTFRPLSEAFIAVASFRGGELRTPPRIVKCKSFALSVTSKGSLYISHNGR